MNVIIHPDYITGLRREKVYEALLAYLAEFRDKKNVWIATPGEVNRWWRQRARMKIVEENGSLRISGAAATAQASHMPPNKGGG